MEGETWSLFRSHQIRWDLLRQLHLETRLCTEVTVLFVDFNCSVIAVSLLFSSRTALHILLLYAFCNSKFTVDCGVGPSRAPSFPSLFVSLTFLSHLS